MAALRTMRLHASSTTQSSRPTCREAAALPPARLPPAVATTAAPHQEQEDRQLIRRRRRHQQDPQEHLPEQQLIRRRRILHGACAATLAVAWAPPWAQASKLGPAVDRAWEALGGGPSDLTFPEPWLGVWDVTSVLQQVELPLGEELVPDANMQAIQRAKAEDLGQALRYKVAFIRNEQGQVVFDRSFNMASMVSMYTREPVAAYLPRIQWRPSDPNVLQLTLPGGMSVRTRVTRRSEEQPEPQRINTSEFLEQVFDSSNMAESSLSGLRVKASQCFTKYRWRDEAAAGPGQPAIVATQVISDYLTPLDDAYLQTMNRPIAQWTYKLAFVRTPAAAPERSP